MNANWQTGISDPASLWGGVPELPVFRPEVFCLPIFSGIVSAELGRLKN
jgi:hypothetical protein